jgi:hypothetical protein
MEPEVCTILFVEAVELLTEGEQEHNNNTSLSLSAGQTELPHCPVCLERLDHHISGVLTTVCNHTFHCTCLSQWADTSCPVCRYILAPPATSHCQVAQHAPSPFPAGSLSYRDAAHHHLRTLERRLHCFNWRHESSTRPVQQLWRFFLALISHPPLSRSLTLECALYCAWSLSGARRLHTLTGRA